MLVKKSLLIGHKTQKNNTCWFNKDGFCLVEKLQTNLFVTPNYTELPPTNFRNEVKLG